MATEAAAGSAVEELMQALSLPETVCSLLASRGYDDAASAARFLRPRLEQLETPWAMHDMKRAATRIIEAIHADEVIFVHGDYDVDGMASTAVLVRVLRGLGARKVHAFVPNRLTDGYDLGTAGVGAALAAGADLVITCDCGTSAHAPVARLMEEGVDVIVTDHHLPGHGFPPAYAVCNPQHPDCLSRDKGLAGAGVAYKLALALCELAGVSPLLAQKQLDLVALATVADVAPLRGENRILVRYGLRMLAETTHPGLRALMRSSGLDSRPLTAGRVGFMLAPRLNAAGRISDAALGLKLLLMEDEDDANALARDLEELNRHRQELDQKVLDDALRQLEAPEMRDRYGLVLHREGWHPGVIGIVASRVVEQTARPAVLVAVEDGVGKGSGRSISAFDLHAGLSACSEYFERFGGHRAAAGLTIREEKLAAFSERFDEVAKAALKPDDLVPVLRVDLSLPIDAIGEELENFLKHFEPFGMGNPQPVFRSDSVKLAAPARRVGSNGLKFMFDTADGVLDGIGWGLADRPARVDPSLAWDVAYRIERDSYRGVSRLQLKVADLRPSAPPGDAGVDL